MVGRLAMFPDVFLIRLGRLECGGTSEEFVSDRSVVVGIKLDEDRYELPNKATTTYLVVCICFGAIVAEPTFHCKVCDMYVKRLKLW
jgi:hypothetical protein